MTNDQTVASVIASIIGTWTVRSFYEQETATGVRHHLFGDKPIGFLTYTDEGRMMALFEDPRRTPPVAIRPTDAEALHLFRTTSAYAGTFSVAVTDRGTTVTHHVEASWNRAWTDTNQVRHVRIEGDRLSIYTDPLLSPVVGCEITSHLEWVRWRAA